MEDGVYYTTGESQIKHGVSNIVELNTSPHGLWTTSGINTENSPLYATIAHEMGHVYGYFALGERAVPDERFGNTAAEIYGTHVENIVRAETGLPLRTHYKTIIDGVGKKFPSEGGRLIDSAGSSIYYDSNRSQITPIPSVDNVLKANKKILQNRYNYYGAAAYFHYQRFRNRSH
ncbi:hypothetical protein [Chryseobacterium sp.]|uniref:hypothetical protein n=1 Tax=Chryseobacterium sp. TaxID=1871047 RepID=UPI0028512F78|nr:hypothetical protein [Chryseobacterium sp.]MDR3024647.1 type III secretion system effector protein [Chryseobacterium sp.]